MPASQRTPRSSQGRCGQREPAGGRLALGLRKPDNVARAVGLALLVLVLGLVAAAALEPLLHGARSQGLTPVKFPGGAEATIGLAVTAVVLVVIGPFAEELYFRGALTAALAPRAGAFTPFATGALFAAAHLELRAFAALFVLGVLLAWLYAPHPLDPAGCRGARGEQPARAARRAVHEVRAATPTRAPGRRPCVRRVP